MTVKRPEMASAHAGSRLGPAFTYTHTVSFEDTNLVGNAYFVRHLAWQGRCRELFLKEHAPMILSELESDLRLVTLKVSCEYFDELRAFDVVEVRMTQTYQRQHRIGLAFDYMVPRAERLRLAAAGFQEIGCMRSAAGVLTPCPVPHALALALAAFSERDGARVNNACENRSSDKTV